MASTARPSGTFANEAGTFMVSCMTGLAASAASKISTTTTAAGAPSLDNGPCVNRDIDVTSTAGSTCTFVDAVCCMTGPSVSAATLASQATIHNTYGVDNADNNRRWTLVPPEFARDSAGPAGVTRHFAMVGDDGAGPAGDTQHFATDGDDDGTLYTTIADKADNNEEDATYAEDETIGRTTKMHKLEKLRPISKLRQLAQMKIANARDDEQYDEYAEYDEYDDDKQPRA